MRLGAAVLADVTLAVALSAMQFVVLEQMRSAFTADRSLLHYGSPLGLLLGEASGNRSLAGSSEG